MLLAPHLFSKFIRLLPGSKISLSGGSNESSSYGVRNRRFGVCEVIETHQDTLAKRTGGKALELARILDLREFPGDKHEALFTKDFNDILNDPEIQIVAETMGGVNPAFDFTMKLLASGKSVVTSNKELVAQKGPELLACAKAHNVNYLIEASVGGGIPIIRPMAQCLAANHIEALPVFSMAPPILF